MIFQFLSSISHPNVCLVIVTKEALFAALRLTFYVNY